MDLKRLLSFGWGIPFAALAVALFCVTLLPFRDHLTAATVLLLAVPLVVGVARLCGVRASAFSALATFLAVNYFFAPPYGRLNVAEPAEWLALVVFLVVALVIGQQTALIGRRERAAVKRQMELELLNKMSFQVASQRSASAVTRFVVEQVTGVLGAEHAVLYAAEPEGVSGAAPERLAAAGDVTQSPEEAAFVAWVVRNNKAVGLGSTREVPVDQRPASVTASEALPDVASKSVYLPLQTSDSLEGVLCVRLPGGRGPQPDEVRLLVAVANLAAASIERQRLEREAARVAALREADHLKTTLVSSVSHELKTPLAAVTARVTGLLDEGEGCSAERVRTELLSVSDDLERLNAAIGDLLDLSRLEADEWRPTFEPYDLAEVLGTVRSRLPADRRDRILFDLDAEAGPVTIDFAQMARALANLIGNAFDYSAGDARVVVGTNREGDRILLWVQDAGPGVEDSEKERVFEKFYRGRAASIAPGGTGLGLAIAREVVTIHGGTVWVEDAKPRGAKFVVSLPAAEQEEGL